MRSQNDGVYSNRLRRAPGHRSLAAGPAGIKAGSCSTHVVMRLKLSVLLSCDSGLVAQWYNQSDAKKNENGDLDPG